MKAPSLGPTAQPRSTNAGETAQVGRRARVCVIGAGCSGLVSIKALREVGHDVQAFDLASRVGGLWVQGSDSGRSAAYDSLRIDTSRLAMQFHDFPMPEEVGDFATHAQVASYFAAYAHHFDLARSIAFRTEVRKVTPTERGYLVDLYHLDTGLTAQEQFDAVLVCTGHHHTPAYPSPLPAGHFEGTVLHSHAYRNPGHPAELRGRRVVVVGFGNSAVDIACELAQAETPAEVVLSVRRGAWVLPRYLFGRPIDQGRILPDWLPGRLRRWIATLAVIRLRGRMTDYGLPRPDHLVGEAHPTLSDHLPELVRRGVISVRPPLVRWSERTVHFADESTLEADAIVFCTGYQVSFPFFDDEHVAAPDNELPLFRRVFHPVHRRLFFVGLAQPLGAIMPISELQARWIAAHLSGHYHLPSPPEMAKDIARERAYVKKRYVASRRHTMQIDPAVYTRSLTAEWHRGSRRATRGLGQPFPPSSP